MATIVITAMNVAWQAKPRFPPMAMNPPAVISITTIAVIKARKTAVPLLKYFIIFCFMPAEKQ